MARKILGLQLLAAIIAMGLMTTAAQAVLIIPGDTIFVPSEPGPIPGKLIDFSDELLTAPTFSGKLHSEVWSGDLSNPLGGLTFVYWIENAGPNSLSRFTTSNFTGFLTDVSYEPTIGKAPTLVDRSGSGDVIGFSYLGGIFGPGKIIPGERSALMVVQTDAVDYKRTLGFVINGSTGSAATFAPTAVVPEPSSMALAGIGIAGALAFAWRRRRA